MSQGSDNSACYYNNLLTYASTLLETVDVNNIPDLTLMSNVPPFEKVIIFH